MNETKKAEKQNMFPSKEQVRWSKNVVYKTIIQRVPANKKPSSCIRNRSQISRKTMDETIGYCSKTIGCTEKAVSYSPEPAVDHKFGLNHEKP